MTEDIRYRPDDREPHGDAGESIPGWDEDVSNLPGEDWKQVPGSDLWVSNYGRPSWRDEEGDRELGDLRQADWVRERFMFDMPREHRPTASVAECADIE